MGIRRGPNIIQSGLVLSLDAGNIRSYPGSGTAVKDSTGVNPDGALQNGASFSATNKGAFNFDGTNDLLDGPSVAGVTTDWTVCIWFYPTSVSNYENPIDCNYAYNGNTGNVGPRLEMDNSGNTGWIWSGDSGTNSAYYYSAALASGLAANTWHFAALSRTSANSIINHLDGEVKSTSFTAIGTPSATFVNQFTNVNIGRGFHLGGTERYFTGLVGPVQIYNRALSASEILQNYNMTKSRFGK